jgi:UDP-glucose 4-epimerase
MRVLITGSTGFIGHHVTKHVLKDNKITSVLLPSRNTTTLRSVLKSNKISRCWYTPGDLHDLGRIVKNYNPHYVLHLAANPSPRPGGVGNMIDDNIKLTKVLLDNVQKKCKFLYASSVVVYGNQSGQCDESTLLEPTSLYGATKAASEALISAYHHMGYIRGTNLRLCATVGKGLTHGIIFDFIKKLKAKSDELEMFGDCPGSSKPFIHVSDVVKAFHMAMYNCNTNLKTYNVCPNDYISVSGIADVVMSTLDIKKKKKWMGSTSVWKGDNKYIHCSNNRIRFAGWMSDYPTSREAICQAVKEENES